MPHLMLRHNHSNRFIANEGDGARCLGTAVAILQCFVACPLTADEAP